MSTSFPLSPRSSVSIRLSVLSCPSCLFVFVSRPPNIHSGLEQINHLQGHIHLRSRDKAITPLTRNTMVTYEVPNKAIITPAQLEQFQQSATHTRVLGYIETLNEAVAGVKLRDACHESEVMSRRCLSYTHTPHLHASCRPSGPSSESSTTSQRSRARHPRPTTPLPGSGTLPFAHSTTESARCVRAVPLSHRNRGPD